MIVEILGKNSGLKIILMDRQQISESLGIDYYQDNNYDFLGSQNLILEMTSATGFYQNLSIESNSDKGAGEIGEVWRGNSIGTKIITINFRNILGTNPINGISPNELLNIMINSQNEIIEMKVITDEVYTQLFHFTEETSLEEGILSFESVDTNEGILWEKSKFTINKKVFDNISKNYFNKILGSNKKLLNEINRYPFYFENIVQLETDFLISVGGIKNGILRNVKLDINGNVLKFTNNNITKNKIINFDSKLKKLTNENNEDITSLLNGNFLPFKVGKNIIKIKINNCDYYYQLFEETATDCFVNLEYDRKSFVISGGINERVC